MKLKIVCKKVYNYVRYDLKEIAFPSSLPDPPNVKKRRKLTWMEYYYVVKEGTRLYAASWVRDIGPELRPNDYKKDKVEDAGPHTDQTTSNERQPSTLEDLAVAARGGMETLRPALQRVYMMRASSYKDALKNFIQGYQEVDLSEEARDSYNPFESYDINVGLVAGFKKPCFASKIYAAIRGRVLPARQGRLKESGEKVRQDELGKTLSQVGSKVHMFNPESRAVPESKVYPKLEYLGNGAKKLCSVPETEIELRDVSMKGGNVFEELIARTGPMFLALRLPPGLTIRIHQSLRWW